MHSLTFIKTFVAACVLITVAPSLARAQYTWSGTPTPAADATVSAGTFNVSNTLSWGSADKAPGVFKIEIYATDADGKQTGDNICTGYNLVNKIDLATRTSSTTGTAQVGGLFRGAAIVRFMAIEGAIGMATISEKDVAVTFGP